MAFQHHPEHSQQWCHQSTAASEHNHPAADCSLQLNKISPGLPSPQELLLLLLVVVIRLLPPWTDAMLRHKASTSDPPACWSNCLTFTGPSLIAERMSASSASESAIACCRWLTFLSYASRHSFSSSSSISSGSNAERIACHLDPAYLTLELLQSAKKHTHSAYLTWHDPDQALSLSIMHIHTFITSNVEMVTPIKP